MWPSQRRASIGLESWQGVAQARSRDRRGIRPIVTLLEERFLLSTPGTIQIAPDISPGGNNAVIVNIITDSNASGQPVTVNEGVYACPFNIIDTNGVTHTDDALSVDLNASVGLGLTSVQPIAISLASASSPTWPGYNAEYTTGQSNELAWLEQAFTNVKDSSLNPGGPTADQYAAIQVEAWIMIDPNFTFSYSGGGEGNFQADFDAIQALADPNHAADPPVANFAGTPNFDPTASYSGTLLSLDPAADGTSQYQNLITPANNTLGIYGALPTINVIGYNTAYNGNSHTATGTATAADGTDLSQYLDLSQTTHTDAEYGYQDIWTFNDPGVYPVESGMVNSNISRAQLTITATYSTKAYDGTNLVTDGATPIVSGLIDHDTLSTATYTFVMVGNTTVWTTSLSPGVTESFDSPFIGNRNTVVNDYVIVNDGNYGNNYTLTINQGPGLITPVATNMVLTASPEPYTYGNNIVFTATLTPSNNSGQRDGEAIRLYDVDSSAIPTDLGAVAIVDDHIIFQTSTLSAGYHHLTATYAGDQASLGSSAQMWFYVSPRGITATLTVADKIYDGTNLATVTSLSLNNTVAGDNVELDYDSANFGDMNAGTNKRAGLTGAHLAGADAGNYQMVANILATATITKAEAIINVTGYDVVYDGTYQRATGTAIGVDGLPIPLNFEYYPIYHGLNLDLTSRVNANGPNGSMDSWTFSDLNYNDRSGTVFDRITQASPTLTVSDAGGIYNGNPYAATATTTGDVTPTVEYFKLANGGSTDLGTTAPVNAGSYEAWATSESSQNWTRGASNIAYFTISQAGVPDSVWVFSYNAVYDGAVHTATGVNPVGNLDLTQTEHTNTGVYTDTVFFHGGQNYVDSQWHVTDTIRQAAAHVNVTPYNVNYNALAHSATGTVTGVNGALPSSDLVLNSAHTNAGTYTDSWTFTNPNYISQSGTMKDTINKADAAMSVQPYNVVYDGAVHNATGSAGLSINSAHINAGSYTDTWSYTDNTGNYNNASGAITDNIAKANAAITVNGYNIVYDGANHTATGAAIGVNGAPLAGLNLAGTTHSTVGTYNDTWIFNSPNYNYAQGTVVSLITLPRVSVVNVTPVWTEVLRRLSEGWEA